MHRFVTTAPLPIRGALIADVAQHAIAMLVVRHSLAELRSEERGIEPVRTKGTETGPRERDVGRDVEGGIRGARHG